MSHPEPRGTSCGWCPELTRHYRHLGGGPSRAILRPGRLQGRVRSVAVALGLATAVALGTAMPAQAHPLGNFSVNHYNGLTLGPAGLDVVAVVDLAEIPTQQELPSIDSDGNDSLSDVELAAHAADQCAELVAAARLGVDAEPVELTVGASSLLTQRGAAGLPTLRLTCELSAPTDLSAAAAVTYTDTYRGDRVGWHELTARGDGLRLVESPVPSTSVSNELRTYPDDLLSSPLDDRSVRLRTEPGDGSSQGGEGATGRAQDPFTRLIGWGDRELQSVLEHDVTPVLGALAVVLSLLLGAGHALLPGHGKTVMAAYLAGRRGSRRDAFMVGATVTGTHTASVLVLGLVISLSAAVVGEQALRYLGVVSGLIIAVVGAVLLRDAVRTRPVRAKELALSAAAAGRHGDPYDAHDHSAAGHDHSGEDHGHSLGGHVHTHAHGAHHHSHGPQDRPGGRGGLIGMGIAGGLVPSPSALVVLLGSVALGRTVFGVLLVLLYGVGMAATLTAVGLLLVRVRGRLDSYGGSGGSGRAAATQAAAARVVAALPVATSVLVLVVGLGLAARGLISPI